MGKAIEEISGAILAILILVDIFLLILYARANKTIFSTEISKFLWRVFVSTSKLLGRWRESFLTLTGPLIIVVVIVTWSLLLSLAMALIIHPNLGTAITANHGDTPTDFITALYVGGSSLSFIGASDFTPQTGFFRLLYLFTSLTGVLLASLYVTYLMEVYTNLKERNTLGLKVHLMSKETGDAAEVIAGLGPQGQFDGGYQNLTEWAAETAQVKESHHFYPVLFYFRFREPFYSVSRTALVSLDTVSLIKSALDDEEYGWLKESAALGDLWSGTMLELRTLANNLVKKEKDLDAPPDKQRRSLLEKRYKKALERLQEAGIKTKESNPEEYISLRAQWDRYITTLAPKFAYDMNDVDTALANLK